MRRSIKALWTPFAFVAVFLIAACPGENGTTSACDDLEYSSVGLTREEYIPCVGEIMMVMDELRAQLEESFAGEKEAHSRARRTYRKLKVLIKKAGGRNLVEGWEDSHLNELNINLMNAYSSYGAAILARTRSDFENARRSHDEARMNYDVLS